MGYEVLRLMLLWCLRVRGQAVARGFGFSVPPRVDLNFSAKGAKGRLKTNKTQQGKNKFSGSGHKFSANNPYGKREAGDKRQFTR